MHKCVNNTVGNVYHLEQVVDNFFPYAQKKLGFDQPVTIIFQSDEDNASKMLGKTAYYSPDSLEVVLYTDNRHPKDIMRSLSHELVHHAQNCRGDFTKDSATYEGYAQCDPHLRKMEKEAYTKGNLIFRDFEDLIKTGKINIEIDFSDSGEPEMSLKEWKNNEINQKLMKKWGLLTEKQSKKDREDERRNQRGNRPSMARKMDLDEENDIFAPNHYCVHHGGVHHEGKIQMAEAINHNFDRVLNRVTHYDMQLQDGTVLHDVPVEDIQITRAALAEGHAHRVEDDEDDPADYTGTRKREKKATSALKKGTGLEERYNPDEPEASDPWDYERGGPGSSRHPRGGYGHSSDGPRIDPNETYDQRHERRRLVRRKEYLDRLPWSAEVADEMKKWEADVKAAGLDAAQLEEGWGWRKEDDDLDESHIDLARSRGQLHKAISPEMGKKGKKRHVVGGDPDVADFIMPNEPKGDPPPPGERVWDPRHLKDKTTKVPPVRETTSDEEDPADDPKHLDPSGRMRLDFERDPVHFKGWGGASRGLKGPEVPGFDEPEPRSFAPLGPRMPARGIGPEGEYEGWKKRKRAAFAKQFKEGRGGKISVREAKEITRRIIERIKKESK